MTEFDTTEFDMTEYDMTEFEMIEEDDEEEALEKINQIKQIKLEHLDDKKISTSVLESLLDVAVERPYLIDEQPELKEKVLILNDIMLNRLSTLDFDQISLAHYYQSLEIVIRLSPNSAEQVFNNTKRALQSDKNDEYSYRQSYDVLRLVIKAHPEMAEQIFDTLKATLQSDKNGSFSLNGCYETLRAVVSTHPELAEQVFDTLKVAIKVSLQSDKNNDPTLSECYNTLNEIVHSRPDLAGQVFDTLKVVLQSDKNNYITLKNRYQTLKTIVCADPNLSEQVFDAFRLVIKSNKNDENSLEKSYKNLSEIAIKRPELAEQVFDTFKLALQSDKNDRHSLSECFEGLGSIIENRPELAEQTFDMFKFAWQSKRNYYSSIQTYYRTLGSIIKNRPELADQAFNAIKFAFQSTKYDRQFEIINCYETLRSIIVDRPELAEKVIDVVKTHGDVPTGARMNMYKLCMKHLPLEETIAKHPEIEQDLRVAHKGRFSTDEEFKYALENFDKKMLAESMIFSAQQRVMNVLVLTSALEKGINKEDALSFRKPDASSKVKDYMKSNQDWLIPASFKGAAIFKEYFPSYIKAIQSYNKKNPANALSIHDAVYWLPEPMDKEANTRFAQFIQKNIIYQDTEHKDVHRPLEELKIIAQNWKTVEKKLQNQEDNSKLTKLKYSYVLSVCMSVKYEDQRNDDFAIEAAQHGTPENEYHNCEDIYLAGLKVPEPFDSKKEFREGKYIGRFLPRDDTRTLFFGDYTNCCQHYGGYGHSCAVSTVKHPFSQLFVIEDDQGKIIAGSWTWENTEGKYREVCFDNIEIKGDFSKDTVKAMKDERETTILKIDNCLNTIKTSKLANLWKDYCQAVKDCDEDVKNTGETKEKISHLIDLELQSKELRKHELGETLAEMWKEHKFKQEHYENHKRVYNAVTSLYEQAGQYLTKEQNCRRVTIGLGYQDADVSGYAQTEAIPLPKLYGKDGTNSYTDARLQVLLAENPNAKPLDKIQESQRYIRDVCFLDKEAMDKVSYTVFPDSDRELQMPDDMSGFVIEDREKGVVGYCLFDKAKKEIYDMAVLPEYRKDKNASSSKLFAEMMRVVSKEGGEWSAEMRDKTTLRYLKAMANRGLVKYEEHGIDHTMSDGSKVVRVTFTPAQNSMQQTINKLRNQVSVDKENDAASQTNNSTQNSGIVISQTVRE